MRFIKVISGIFFVSAAGVLVFGKQGILNLPGIGAALAALAFLYYSPFWAMAIGFLSATASFSAQAFVGICPSCTLSATLFLLAGICLYRDISEEYPVKTLICAVPVIVSLGLFVYYNPFDTLALQTYTAEAKFSMSKETALYYSPLCRHCEEPLKKMIERDPQGKTWTPVVVPANLAVQEKHILREKGYSGPVASAWKSPSGALPCLVVGNEIYQGSQAVLNYLEKESTTPD